MTWENLEEDLAEEFQSTVRGYLEKDGYRFFRTYVPKVRVQQAQLPKARKSWRVYAKSARAQINRQKRELRARRVKIVITLCPKAAEWLARRNRAL